jgi:2-dehydropantoate 2-reductase
MSRRYAILGTGAVGGYYGGLLARSGLDVHFLLRSDYAHVKQHGLTVASKDGDYRLPQARAYQRAADMPRCDVAVICLKTTHNHLLADLLPPVVADDGVVLMIQNGLGVEDAAAAVVGPDRVLGGLAFLCSNKIGPGHIHHLDYGKLSLGEWRADAVPGGVTPRLREIGDDFAGAGVDVELADDLVTARWR